MADFSQSLHDWFWSPKFWLPGEVKWEQISPTVNNNYPKFSDILIYPLIICFFLQLFRVSFLNPLIFVPFATKHGLVKSKNKKTPSDNAVLDNLIQKSNGTPSEKQITNAVKDLKWSRRKIERWIRDKKLFSRPSKLDKFLYSSYLTIFHFFSIILGSTVLYNKPWVADITQTIMGIPFHEISSANWWYYMLSTGFYYSVSFFSHHNSKVDLVHHVSTLTLLTFSWACNLVRAGTLVLYMHEFGDMTLQFSKVLDYLKWEYSKNVAIGLFTIVFVFSRAVVFPFWIIRSMIMEPPKHMSIPPSAFIFYTFLILLLIVNIYWCYLIMFVVGRTLVKGEAIYDVRSESISDNNSVDENSGLESRKK